MERDEERLLLLLRISSLSLLDGVAVAVLCFRHGPFMEVVPFGKTEAAATIRPEKYPRRIVAR